MLAALRSRVKHSLLTPRLDQMPRLARYSRLRPMVAGLASGAVAGGVGLWTWQDMAGCQEGGGAGRWTFPTDTAATLAAAAPTQVKIASYNVLSDSLCRASQFTHCALEDLDNTTRLERVKLKLAAQMEAGCVICMQEVSREWAGQLVPLFEKHGYNHMDALSGSGFSGYMGQCLAWPTALYSAEDVCVKRVADTVEWPRPKRERTKERPPFDARREALQRHNCVVLARLRAKDTGRSFAIACYHMPCLFGSDEKCQTMVMHASWLVQFAQRWAAGVPLVVAGDFNIQPGDPTYNLIAHGTLPSEHAQYPQAPPDEASDAEKAWLPGAMPMRSAYATASPLAGQSSSPKELEPEFTNYAWTPWGGCQFCETLDYIWLSEEWGVEGVVELLSRKELTVESFPSAEEPSDHMLIGATLSL